MGENLKVRTFVVVLLLALSLWLVGKPILIDHKSPLTEGLDIRGGVSLRYQFLQKDLPPGQSLKDTVDIARQIFGNRLDALAVKEISIRPIGDSQIEVAVPGITLAEAEAIQQTLESIGRLELRLAAHTESGVNPDAERERLAAEIKRRTDAGEEITDRTDFSSLTEGLKLAGSGVTFRWIPKSAKMLHDEIAQAVRLRRAAAITEPAWNVPEAWVLVRYDPREGQSFTGSQIAGVYAAPDSESGQQAVGFEIKAGHDAQMFADWTEKNVSHSIVTMLDNQVQSLANIESRIEGHGIIRGGSEGFTPDEIKRLISVIKSGSLSQKPVLAQKFTQGPSLGEDSVRRGLHATIMSFAIVAGFMLIYYRLNGVIAVFALVSNVLLQVASMAWLHATLTLPGIAGLILTIGVAVDANILISERIREELEKGKTVAQAVKNGFDRAWTTIFDSHLTAFIAGFFLYQFGTGAIRGFAVTLLIGIATSLLTGVYFSHTVFLWLLQRGVKSMSMMRMLHSPNLHFLKYAKVCYVASALVTVVGCAIFFIQDDRKYGMDFTGGFEVQVQLAQPATQEEILALVKQRYTGPDVVSVNSQGGKATNFQIKIKQTDLDAAEVKAGDAPTDDKMQESDRFGANVAALFAGKLVEDGIQKLDLGAVDAATGHVPVHCELHFEADAKKAEIEPQLKKNGLVVEKLDGPDQGRTFTLAGYFTRDPGNVATARGLLSPRLKAPNGVGEVLLSNPMPAKSYIGPRAGGELRDAAIRAIVLSLLAIIVYARMRFAQYRFGIAAVVALIHDVLVAVGAIGIARLCGYPLEVDLTVVAALLTIIGYSINDTIVVFDRIRENMPRLNLPIEDVVDRSCNQILGRTILTSLTVFMTMAILFIYNVGQHNALEGFAFAMLVGVVTGTYSSIYVASALLVHIAHWTEKRKNRPKPPAPAATPVPV